MLCSDCMERNVYAKSLCKRCYTRKQRREYYKANPEKYRIKAKKWYKNNRESVLATNRKRLPLIRIYRRQYENKIRLDILKLMGNKCVKCGFDNWMGLQLDHINGGGTKEMREFKRPKAMYRFYLANPLEAKKRIQVLCANCNQIKRYLNNENRKR